MICENILLNNKYLSHELKKQPRYSLSAITKKYLDIDINSKQGVLFEGYESKETRDLYRNLAFDNLSLELVKYSAADILLPFKAYPKQYAELVADEQTKVAEFENEFLLTLAEMEYNGFKCDKESWLKVLEYNKELLTESYQSLNRYLMDNKLTHYIGIN